MKYIVPFIHSVDYIFNGSLPYEFPYHKMKLFNFYDKMIEQFRDDPKKSDAYMRAQRAYDLLKPLKTPADDSDVPGNSLLREFIGGSTYHY
jgi:uridine kinase